MKDAMIKEFKDEERLISDMGGIANEYLNSIQLDLSQWNDIESALVVITKSRNLLLKFLDSKVCELEDNACISLWGSRGNKIHSSSLSTWLKGGKNGEGRWKKRRRKN